MSGKKKSCVQPAVSAGQGSRGQGMKAAEESKKEPIGVFSPETVLLDRVLAGENDLFYELVRPHQTMLFGMAMAIVKDEAEAEDVVQETVPQSAAKLASFERLRRNLAPVESLPQP